MGEAHAEVEKLTWGQMADQALILVGTVDEQVVSSAFDVIGKGGTVVITGLGNMTDKTVQVSGTMMALFGKTITGTLFGSANPQYDIVKLLRLYDEGKLKLDELITREYDLADINKGYDDMNDGNNVRGFVRYSQS